LIDGEELARLMIERGVGVRIKETYELKSLDEEYFLGA
jgi:restriction system protein